MRRKFVLVLLGLGSLFGFAAGVHSWRGHSEWGSGHRWGEHRFDRVAEACVRAAERVRQGEGSAAEPAAPVP